MKLCITCAGKDKEAAIDTAFGRAPYFFIIDTNTNSEEIVANSAVDQDHGAGIAAAQLLADRGVDAVLTGQVGPNTFAALQAAGIKLFVGASSGDTVNQALAKFKTDHYQEANNPSTAPHCGPGPGRGQGHGRGQGRGRCRQK